MAECSSSPSDQLWNFAASLFEDANYVPFVQQEEHGLRIQTKYNQLVINLSCLGDIIATMFEKGKLTLKELEQIQHLQSTPIRANEELLSIIARKPRHVYECFLSIIKDMNQLHLYQMLVSGDDEPDKAKRDDVSHHRDLIRRNFMWLSEKLDTENGLVYLLYEQSVLTFREKEFIMCSNNAVERNELLFGLFSKKSPEDYEKFLEAMEASGQGHLAKKLRKPDGSHAEYATVPSAIQTPRTVCCEMRQNVLQISGQKSVPVFPPKPHPISSHKPITSLSKPPLPPKPTTLKRYAKLIPDVARTTEKAIDFRTTVGISFRSKLKGLETHLQTDIAIKIVSVSLLHLDKPEDGLKMCLSTLLQECHQMRNQIVAKNDERSKELEQLRYSANQYSAVAALNEVNRTQLNSMQQKLTSERLQNEKERMQSEEKMSKLTTDVQNEKFKCKRLEEKLINNSVIMELKARLEKAEYNEQCYKQQLNELNTRLASTECELQKCKTNSEMRLLEKKNEIKNYLEEQSLCTQKNNQELVSEKDRILELAEEEMVNLIRPKLQKGAMELKSLVNDLIDLSEFQEDLDSEKHSKQELENQFIDVTTPLEQINSNLEGRYVAFVTKVIQVIRKNHQLLVENMKSSRLIDLLHAKYRIMDERGDLLKKQPFEFYRNDALLQLVKTTPFWHENGQQVLEEKHDFVADLLEKDGESHSIIRNREFLVENINSSSLIDLLHEENCITCEELDHLKKQPSSFYRNDALLQLLRKISFRQDKGKRVLECFRQTEQNFIADLLRKGGVLIRSKILTKLARANFTKSSSKKLEELLEREFAVMKNLNKGQGLSLSMMPGTTSEIQDDDIVIAPYCYRESDGIVMWFWCQSNSGQRNLKSIYGSGMLLGKLADIFTLYAAKLLVPTSITIFVGDLKMDEGEFQDDTVNACLPSSPIVYDCIRTT